MQYIGELTGDQIINMIDEEIKLIDYTGDITLTNTTTKKTLIITTNNQPLIITPKKPTEFLDLPVEIRQIIKNTAEPIEPVITAKIIEPKNPPKIIEPKNPPKIIEPKNPPKIIEPKNPAKIIEPKNPPKIIEPKNPISLCDNDIISNKKNYLIIDIDNDDISKLKDLKNDDNIRYLLKILKNNNYLDLYNKYDNTIKIIYHPSNHNNIKYGIIPYLGQNKYFTIHDVIDINKVIYTYKNYVITILNKHQNELYLIFVDK
jgi:hypothetical protein